MSYYSMEKYYAPDQTHKAKMSKLIRNKLTPLSEYQKFPMGKNSFLSFKNLQKMPKIKRQHFSFKTKKSQHQEAIMNDLMTKQLYKSDEHLSNQVYNKPSSWLNIWKKMGDQLQKTYLTKRQKNQSPPFFRQFNKNCQQSLTTRRDKYQRHSDFIKSTQQVLQKVQIYKKKKLQQIQKLKRKKSSLNLQRNSANNIKQAQPTETVEDYGNVQRSASKAKQNQKNINNDWVFFITKIILDKHVNKTDQQIFFQQFIKRKQQNKLKQFISEFEADKKIHRSCHLEPSYQLETSQRLKQQRSLKKNQQNSKNQNISTFEEKKSELLAYNNPTLRLRKLKSKCKSIEPEFLEQKENAFPYNCNKLRINSNHKKIIQTTKNIGKA